ncbi:protein HOTHEAD-like [Cynara cardunculus var. scolymus]|uniref:protein HOTHEAD-like n=1 Tax=Cynara cardunculus var. scolymus TaxID=59895 RepID=UPI000D624B87|nr:protein HOTHEAD-like [Cynara cardunculus var. scolymus]
MGFLSWRMVISALVTILFFHEPCLAEIPPSYTFIHEATKAPKISFYDYIVIGGGTAGIPIATTLSESYSVLLLERGGSPYGNPNITEIGNFGSTFRDSSPNSPSQRFVSEDGVVNVRGKVLGGGTAINAGIYSRGEGKFKNEARLMDDDLIGKSYGWVEKVMVFKPVMGRWQSAMRGALIEAGVTPDNGFSYDHIIGTKVTGTIFDQNGTRHTAADLLRYANPKGLSLLLHATVHKILFKTNGKSKPTAYGVVFQDSLGNKHRAYLKGDQKDEIILSAGSLGSPQLLMLSGIGPKDQLDAHKIKVVHQHPFVGQGMADNPLSTIFVPSPIPVEPSGVQVVGITRFGSYIEGASSVNFIFASPSDYQGFSYEVGGFIFEKINGPISHGELKLQNLDPSANPSVTFNYYKEPKDLQKCVGGVKTILTAVESKAFSKFKYRNMTAQDILDLNAKLPTNLPIDAKTSSSFEQFCKDTVKTLWHYHGGCQIGKVVDHEYKVFGVDGLRVIDGSTILNSPGTNPQASILMLGRYMGVTILRQRLASDKSR